MATSDSQKEVWSLDQLTKSEFFHQKLHEWDLLDIARAIEQVVGETLDWKLENLEISQHAWNKVIHRGIKPVIVFAHPHVLEHILGSITYYRMLAMVSQKSMTRVGMSVNRYEDRKATPDQTLSLNLARHLNKIISHLVEIDEQIRENLFQLLGI
jgi:hypothetical protein